MRRRWIVGGVLAVLLGVSATGIAVNHEWLGGRWDAATAATRLADRLQALDGVTAATATYNPVGLPEPTMAVSVSFAATSSSQVWGEATALITEAGSSHSLRGVRTTAAFRQRGSAASATVDPSGLSAADVSAAIADWKSLRATVGDAVSLVLDQHGRQYGVTSAARMKQIAAAWPADVAGDDTAHPAGWLAPGVQLVHLPTSTEMAVLTAASQHVSLAPTAIAPGSDGSYGVILGDALGFKLTVFALRGEHYSGDAPDRTAIAAISAALDAHAPVVEWMGRNRDALLTTGDCPVIESGGRSIALALRTSSQDTRLAAELAAAGVELPVGVRPGSCQE